MCLLCQWVVEQLFVTRRPKLSITLNELRLLQTTMTEDDSNCTKHKTQYLYEADGANRWWGNPVMGNVFAFHAFLSRPARLVLILMLSQMYNELNVSKSGNISLYVSAHTCHHCHLTFLTSGHGLCSRWCIRS